MTSTKLTIGIITYGNLTARYLPYFFSSLKQQTFADYNILVLDNSEQADNENKKIVEQYPDVDYQWVGENLGFAKGYNLLMKKAIESDSQYFLTLNPDMILEPTAVEKLVKALDNNSELGSVSPKVLRWDFVNKEKTSCIDSCGIILLSGLRFVDLGQGENDSGQYDQSKIIGPSGCSAMYRLSALEKVKESNQYYDENFFMYKEDVDLAYRLQLSGWGSKLISSAIIYHDRTVGSKGSSWLKIVAGRKGKSKINKEQSFLGQLILFYKYWHLQSFWQKIMIISYLKRMFIFIILFERYLLKQYTVFKQLKLQLKQYK